MQAPDSAVLPGLADELALLLDVAQAAAPIAMEYFGAPDRLDIQLKHGDSPVSAGDYAVDAYLRRTLLAARPAYGWLSEETEDADPKARMSAPRTFVVDPIDGTRAYISGQKTWCISAALVEDGRPVAGVLVCPAMDETYAAMAGGGATCNGQTMNNVSALAPSLGVAGNRGLVGQLAASHDARVTHHRHVPSLAYRMAMVASGELGGTFVRHGSHDWDIAAAMVILAETGCVIAARDGETPELNGAIVKKPDMVAAHPALVAPMQGVATD